MRANKGTCRYKTLFVSDFSFKPIDKDEIFQKKKEQEVRELGYDKAKVKESIEPENVYDILEYFGAEPEMYSDYIISRTICHNGIGEGTKKLYYYFENSMFN